MRATFGTLVVDFFRTYLVNQKGVSKNTIASYSDCIYLLITYCCKRFGITPDKLAIESIDEQVVLDFLDYLERERGNAPATRNQRLDAIKSFFRFLAAHEPTLVAACERVCAISHKATETNVIEALTHDDVHAIINATDPVTLNGARDRALFMLMYNTGARVQELVDLTLADLRLQAPAQVLLTGKGRKQRIVPLWKETVAAIQHYCELRQAARISSKRLFLNARGKPITRFGIGHLVTKYTRIAAASNPFLGDRTVTPHTFRHTTALHLIQTGVDIVTVKEWLGHADIKTTMQYLEINLEMKRQALEKYPPPDVSSLPEKPRWQDNDILQFLNRLSRASVMLSDG